MRKNTFIAGFVIILLLLTGVIGWYWFKNNEALCERIQFCDQPEETDVSREIQDDEEKDKMEVRTREIREETEKYNIKATYPYLIGEPEVSADIQRVVDNIVLKFKRDAEEIPVTPFHAELMISFETKFTSDDLASFLLLSYTYMGGAHGLERPIGANYDLSSGRRITLDSIFNEESGYLEFLSRQARNEFRDSLGIGFFEEGAGPLKTNFEDFTVTDKEATFYFEPYQVAAYAAGIQDLRITLPELEPYLSESFKELYN